MKQPASTSQMSRTRQRYACDTQSVVVRTPLAEEIYTRIASNPPLADDRPALEQLHSIYDCLPDVLAQQGVAMDQVVWERVFFRDLLGDLDMVRRERQAAYRAAGVSTSQMPLVSYLHQPPCRPNQAFELQTYAVVPTSPETASVKAVPTADAFSAGKVVQIGPYRHLYITNINGHAPDAPVDPSFRHQSDAMFAKMPELLRPFGIPFRDVLRTWCYLDDIDRDYAEFNLSRNAFFLQEGVQRLPASTGIRSGLQPAGTLCGVDLYALLNPEGAKAEVMHTPTLNEAPEYGSAFARGMRVDLPEKTVLYISGTASVDEAGATVHLNDVRKQIERTLLNIRELLSPHGATFADMVQVISYLKSASYFDLFEKILAEWDISRMPNTIVEAGVCRPDLLVEIEGIAILPKT